MSDPDSGTPLVHDRPRVLLVDDNAAANRGLARLLTAAGFEVNVAHDGASALIALRSDPPVHFLLTDLSLPDLDGRELARLASQLAAPPRVALITGWDLEHGLAERAAWGIEWVFAKPLNVTELIERLCEAWVQDHP